MDVDTVYHAAIDMEDAVVATLDEADWPATFRDLQISSLSAVPLTHWYLNNDDALRSVLDLLDTAGPPAQAYENRKGQLSLLGIDWVVNLTRPAINLGPVVGIDVYTEQSASVDVESQINAATAEVSSWTVTTAADVVWFTQDVEVADGRSLTLIANFRDVVTSTIDPTGRHRLRQHRHGNRHRNAAKRPGTRGGNRGFGVRRHRDHSAPATARHHPGQRTAPARCRHGTQPALPTLAPRRIGPATSCRRLTRSMPRRFLNRLVGAYSTRQFRVPRIRVRLEDNYAVASQLQHLVQVNVPDRDGQTYAGFVRQTRKVYTTTGDMDRVGFGAGWRHT